MAELLLLAYRHDAPRLTAAALGWVATTADRSIEVPALVFFGALSGVLSILSFAVALKGRIHPLRLPATTLFALLSACCWMAMIR